MNLTDEPRTLYRGTRIGEAHVVTKYYKVEGRLPAVSHYDGDSEDSEDERWPCQISARYHTPGMRCFSSGPGRHTHRSC